jgi:signal transduction histidine kinase
MMDKILCIGDEPAIREIMVEELQDAGYETIEAGNGREGLQAITVHRPDLVLCDITMPEMNGYQVLTELREKHSQLASVPFVFLSALADRKDVVAGKRLGADDYLTKPIDFDILLATVDARLRQVKLLKERIALERRVTELEEYKKRLEEQAAQLMRMAKELSAARDEAEAANRAKSEFLALVSHELRTPLNAIIGFSELIMKEMMASVDNPKYREYATNIHESGRHLLDLINDIFDLSKIESGAVELHEDEVEVPEVIRSVLTLMKERATEDRVETELDIPNGLPLLRVDRRKLKQILVNILSNGIKFTRAGGKVALRVWCGASDGYVFQIADSGIGIACEDIPKALAPFGQVDSDLNREYPGTGLGLALTKSLVEMHGGSLDLHSEVDVGTTVTVRFPAGRTVMEGSA